MNEQVTNVILGIAANGLTTALTRILQLSQRRTAEILRRAGFPTKSSPASKQLTSSIDSAIETLLLTTDLTDSQLRTLLSSPEIAATVQHIFAFQLSTHPSPTTIGEVRQRFIAHAAYSLEISTDDAAIVGARIFDVVIRAIDSTLQCEIDNGSTIAAHLRTGMMYTFLSSQLANIDEHLRNATQPSPLSLTLVDDFDRDLRYQVGIRHRYITPPFIDEARRVPIDQIYVTPQFTEYSERRAQGSSISLEDFTSSLHRTVVLGNPGAGKSSLAIKMCQGASSQFAGFPAGAKVTPLLIQLRDYSAFRSRAEGSLVDYIALACKIQYLVEPPPRVLPHLLVMGRLLLIFDGLDELAEVGLRQQVRSDVEAFCYKYINVPVMITSRKVGYSAAPLDAKLFEVYELSPFDSRRVAEYAFRWFAVVAPEDGVTSSRTARQFIAESATVPDLISNPLMLSLMCNIYRGEHFIPQNRAEIYDKCASMLFEQWDKQRGLWQHTPMDFLRRPLLAHIAEAILGDINSERGVTLEWLGRTAAGYIHPRFVTQREEAEAIADSIIDSCRGRAWVFTDTGSDEHGRPLYQFTHRTFLEYFVAVQWTRQHPTSEALTNKLDRYITNQQYDVICQLALQIHARNSENAADEVIEHLLGLKHPGQGVSRSKLGFVIRSLGFLYPQSATLQRIIAVCLNEVHSVHQSLKLSEVIDTEYFSNHMKEEVMLISQMLYSGRGNRVRLQSAITDTIGRQQSIGELELAGLCGDMLLNLDRFIEVDDSSIELASVQAKEYWRGIWPKTVERTSDKLCGAGSASLPVAIGLVDRRMLDVVGFCSMWPADALMKSRYSDIAPGVNDRSALESILDDVAGYVAGRVPFREVSSRVKDLEEVGDIVARLSMPWVLPENLAWSHERMAQYFGWMRLRWLAPGVLSNPAMVGALVGLATLGEILGGYEQPNERASVVLRFLGPGRAVEADSSPFQEAHRWILDRPFETRAKNLLTDWVGGKCNLAVPARRLRSNSDYWH